MKNDTSAPRAGMPVWVQTGTHPAIGESHRISSVNSRSFYVSHRGVKQRHLLPEWRQWLTARQAEGKVFLDGCELPACLAAPSAETRTVAIQASARDARFLRAARDVLKRYRFEPAPAEQAELVGFDVRGGTRDYRVDVWRDWRSPPRCSCPDAQSERAGGFCKHVVAVLLREPELRYQLLDALI